MASSAPDQTSSLANQPKPLDQPPISEAANRVNELLSVPLPAIKPAAPTKRQIAISIFLVILLVLLYSPVIMGALDGEVRTTIKSTGIGLIFWTGLTSWYVWKSLNRRPWVGAFVGVAFSIAVFILALLTSGYVKGQRSDILDEVPAFAAMKRTFPVVAEQLRQDLRTLPKDESLRRQQLAAMSQKTVMPTVAAAMNTTSDAAMVKYARAKLRQFEQVAKANKNDCVMLMLGDLEGAGPEARARIAASTTSETKQALEDAFVKILSDADAFRNAPPIRDEKRFNALYEQLDTELKMVHGSSAYDLADDSPNKSMDARCKSGQLLFSEVLKLSDPARSFMLRSLFAQD